MSGLHKIFLATVLVVVGFGVAKFLGQPALLKQALGSRDQQPQALPTIVQTAEMASIGPRVSSGVRLVPETPLKRVEAPTSTVAAISEPPLLGSWLESVMPVSRGMDVFAMPRPSNSVPIASAPIGETAAPRAKLRNEAPRPVGVDPQSPIAIRRAPPVNDDNEHKVSDVQTYSTNWPAPQVLNTSYVGETATAPAATITASMNDPPSAMTASQVSPPPWPVPEMDAEPRTHIIVDGDSLERLAGRYLSDPHRGREIYELNRDVLSSPDLLPIGVELKLPDRIAAKSSARGSWRPNSSNAKPSNEIISNNLVPIGSPSSPQGIIPRAQLARPVTVQ